MSRRLTAIVEREGDGYVALCPEVDVASQGDTVAEARENLQEALTLFFETASADEIEYCVHLDEHEAGPMIERHSIAEARRNFPSLVHDAENGKAVEITRRGEPVAVLIGHRDFERLTAGRRGFSEAYREFADAVDLREFELDPEELFGDLREEAAGREVRL